MTVSDAMVERGAKAAAENAGFSWESCLQSQWRADIRAALTAALSDQVVVPKEQAHQTIWLQPWCDDCEKQCSSGEGRMWCQDDVWGQCEGCDRKPVKYIIAPYQSPASTDGEV